MPMPFFPGRPALQILDPDGEAVVKTLYLPPPDKGSGELEWVKKTAAEWELLDGSARERVLGYVPKLSLRWKTYNDMDAGEKALGPLSGNVARIQDLLVALATPGGRLRVLPGPPDPALRTISSPAGIGQGDGTKATWSLITAAGRSTVDALGTWPVYTTPRMNLLTRSQAFSGTWSLSNATVTDNQTVAPDGTQTAGRMVENTANAAHILYKANDAIPAGAVLTYSLFLKANGRTKGRVFVCNNAANSGFQFEFDLVAMTATVHSNVGTGTIKGTPSILAIGNGWYRVSATGTIDGNSTQGGAYVYTRDAAGSAGYTGDGTSGFYVWGAQLEPGNTATAYIPTTSAAVTVTPSWSASEGFEVVYNVSGLRVYVTDWQGTLERFATARTNMMTWSQDLANAAWTKSGTAIGATSTAPDGTATMQKLSENTATSAHYIQHSSVTITVGKVYTTSVHVRSDGRRYVVLQGDGSAGALGSTPAGFDLQTGTLVSKGSMTDATITKLADGSYRITATATATGNAAYPALGLRATSGTSYESYAGDGASGVYAWGWQIEEGSVSTAYNLTLASPVTRTDYTLSGSSVTLADGAVPINETLSPAGDGNRTQWTATKTPVQAALFRQDWQGKQLMYPTARTNLCLYSSTFTDASWAKTNLTDNGAVAGPSGSNDARSYTATGYAQVSRAVTGLTAGQAYTLSCWVRKPDGTGTVKLATTETYTGALTVGSTWTRVNMSFVAAGTSTAIYLLGPNSGWAPGITLELADVQVEAGWIPTSYLPTTTAALTRTDYTLSGATFTFAVAPVTGATVSWSGYHTGPLPSSATVSWSGSYRDPQVGFRALVKKLPKMKLRGPGLAEAVEIELLGYEAPYPTPSLPVVI